MAKESGITTTINIDDSGGSARDISNDILNWDVATPREEDDVTGQDQSAPERLLLLADYSATFVSAFDDASNVAHDVFKTVPSTSVARTVSVAISGQTLAVEAFLTDYALTRGQNGSLRANVPAVLANGSVPTWA